MLDLSKFQSELRRQNLSTWDKSSATWRAIPVALSPVVVANSDWQLLVHDARLILACFPRVLSWIQRPENQALWQRIFGGLDGIEREAARCSPDANSGFATMRFDLFWHGDDLKVIEANCTIPAMQAYSDMVMNAWSAANGMAAPIGGNSDDLLDSLLASWRRDGGGHDVRTKGDGRQGQAARPRVAILHREGDSQLAELMYLEDRWQDRVEAFRTTPAQWGQRSADFVYRHIFASRLSHLSGHSQLLTALRDARRHRIYNPVSAHYEVKAFLAMVSVLASNDHLSAAAGLSPEQRAATCGRVPWTRVIASAKFPVVQISSEFGESEADFIGNCADFVIKGSSGYGGHLVFVGSEWDQLENQVRLKNLLKVSHTVTPALFWRWITAESSDVWIIQRRMAGRRHKSQVILSGKASNEVIHGYVDASVFLNSGAPPLCGGGVSRFSAGPVVNIGAGGGLAPLIIENEKNIIEYSTNDTATAKAPHG